LNIVYERDVKSPATPPPPFAMRMTRCHQQRRRHRFIAQAEGPRKKPTPRRLAAYI